MTSMVLLKMSTGVDMLWCDGSAVGGMIGGSGWRLCVSSALFYFVQRAPMDSSDGKSGLVRVRVHGQLLPTCCLHRGSPST